jgi:cysteine desulfurase
LDILEKRLIYLDNNSTTKIDERVVKAMLPYLSELCGNPSSTHSFGIETHKAIQQSRKSVAELINSETSDIVFTSGGTESINLALKGYAFGNQNKGRHIITAKSEHKAVLDTCLYLESVGFTITYLPVNRNGVINVDELYAAFKGETILVSVMFANNETGVLQRIKEIAEISHAKGAAFMCDATQALGKIEIDVEELQIDLMPFSGHKFYGPKGVGGLYIKGLKKKKTYLEPLQHGGGHENGLRSGTLNVTGIVGMGAACKIAMEEMKFNANKILVLRDLLEKELLKIPHAYLNGDNAQRMYNVSNICFPGIDANIFIGKMKNIAVSTGSACSSSIIEPSHVLKAMGLSDVDAMASIRFSLGKYNTDSEIYSTIDIVHKLIDEKPVTYA